MVTHLYTFQQISEDLLQIHVKINEKSCQPIESFILHV